MRATRRSQPYRKGPGRAPSPTLRAMKQGRSLSGYNPQDVNRLAVKKAAKRRRRRLPR